MTSAEGQVSLSDLRVESRTSIDAARSAGYAMCIAQQLQCAPHHTHQEKEWPCQRRASILFGIAIAVAIVSRAVKL